MSSIACESCQDLSEEEKKSDIMIRSNMKISLNIKSKGQLSIEKSIKYKNQQSSIQSTSEMNHFNFVGQVQVIFKIFLSRNLFFWVGQVSVPCNLFFETSVKYFFVMILFLCFRNFLDRNFFVRLCHVRVLGKSVSHQSRYQQLIVIST